MSEEDSPKYKDGDVVWVKLGPCWWPGEVTENGPEDFSSKKPPLAIVKFFNESTYEFVKSYNNIYFYNCERKNEFIKKGMDSFRANNSHMEKFPGDVSLAEIRTDGNPNILSDPMFAPQKRSNIIAEVFGSPSPKKANKEGARHSRGRSSTSKNSAKKQTKVNITHRRFLGCDDYEAHIRVQYPGKDAGHLSSDEEITRLNAEPTQTFDCSSCSFNTTRLEVMLFHVQCHIKGIASPVQVKKKSAPKKKRSRIVKHITSDDDRTNSSAGYVDTDSEEEAKPKQKRKRRSQGGSAKRTKQKKTAVEEEKTAVTDIRTNLLAEWSDSEENDDGESSKLDTSGENVEETGEKENKEEQSNNQQKDLSKSCFDFDEEEEEDNSIIHTAVGRKIPRVIPEKRKSTDPDNEDASLPLAEDDENRMEILKVNENLNENSTEKDSELMKEESQFKDLMESTSVPDLPEVPDTIKPSPPNLSDGKSAKIPDKKNDNNVTEVATKLTNPKKRFVKSFEDFELLLNEQRRAQEEREEELRRDKKKEKVTVEPVEAVEPKIVEDLDTKVPQTEDSSSMELEEPIEEMIQEKTEQKLTESTSKIEDKEDKPVEKEETKTTESVVEEEAVEEQKRIETPVEASKPVKETLEEEKSEEIGKDTTEEESSGESSKISDSNLQISKLKCQIMSKLSDEDVEPPKSSKTKSSQHKTPRSKILDKYNEQRSKRSSRSSEEKEEPTWEESVVNSSNKKGHASKKSKYLKFNQEDATGSGSESIEKIEEEPTKEDTSKDVIKEVETMPEKTNPDEEIRKINQIDEYFKDFLFSFHNKKEENSPKETVTEEMKIAEESSSKEEEEKPITNEVRIKCAGSDEESEGDLDIAIKTNLTNFNKNDEEMSALSTLAMVSQLENNFEKSSQEEEKIEEETPTPAPVPETLPEPVKPNFDEHFVKKPESELITIDGNLTVVSEKDLADGQVEITANASPSYKKPVTLTNFSMDFSECNSNSDSISSEQSDSKSQEEIKTADSNEEVTKKSSGDVMYDLEEHIPSQIVDKTKPAAAAAATATPPTSKLLERLTTTVASSPEVKVPVSKTAPKVPTTTTPSVATTKPTKTKFVIKQPQQTTPNTNNKFARTGSSPAQTTSSSKPIILSEKIIKPAKVPTESAGSVSVQKITSKRNLHDPDEIDTYIIQKEGKNVEEEEELELSLGEDLPEVPTKKFKRAPPSGLVKKLQHQQQTPSQTAIKKRAGGKAKILQQTIITPAGEIIQPTVAQTAAAVTDDNVFDINSMPIVLSDQILTPESIENMPIFLSDAVQTTEVVAPITTTTKLIQQQQPTATVVKKSPAQGQMRLLNKSMSTPPSLISASTTSGGVVEKKLVKTPKILGSVGSKIIKQNSFAAGSSSKHGKYVIVTQSSSSSTPQAKYAVAKKQPTLIKRTGGGELTGTLTKMTPEHSGNKIMILTNQQGQQQRVLLTPAQQKMMGYQTSQGGKVTKTVVKGNIIQKGKDGQMAVAGSSGLISKSIGSSRMNSNQTLMSSGGHILTQIHPHQQQKIARIDKSSPMSSATGRKIQMQSQKVPLKPQQKTILIKNQHGQTVRKIQGTDDALLDQQVAEQLEAIKASGMLQQKQEILNYKTATPSKTIRRSYAKKVDSPKQQMVAKMATNANLVKAEAAVPPLAPISPKKPEQQIHMTPTEKVAVTNQQQETKAQQQQQQQQQERPLNQLVIQDAMGNQTTITEGQILALPSETVDGQPQSYMLVTLDESGNLTPLNNEALLSLDPNLGLGGDLGNTVLQIDQSALKEETTQQEIDVQQQQQQQQPEAAVLAKQQQQQQQQEEVKETIVGSEEVITAAEKTQEQLSVEAAAAALQTVNCSVGAAETGQQLIVTGDPIAAQKFLESLTEGNTDLANILASAEGSSILIQADGQQILINTDSDNQMLLSVNTDNLNMAESSEGGGNPIFATQPPSKNQDILAAALADTDVFQQEQQNSGSGAGASTQSGGGGGGGNAGNKVVQSQLSPNSALYPINVGNVLETSLTLNSPIMTPLEVPSTNSKKIISDENDILNQVPKNVDLPITITDPNISQTVSQQQVASLMVNELQSNLELSLPITESITVASSEMNSPSFVYSLPNLDGSVDIGQKAFNSSMPLLTEDGEESAETPPKKEAEEEEVEREEEASSSSKTTTTTTPPPPPSTTTTAAATEDASAAAIEQKRTMEEDAKSEDSKIASEGSFLDESEGLCTLGSEMCSSLSEPPPDMFDLSAVLSSHHQMKTASPTDDKQTDEGKSVGGGDNMEIEEAELKIDDKVGEESVSSESANQESVSTSSPATMMNEDSCEIPVQPEIVTTLKESDGFEDEAAAAAPTTTTSNDKEEEVVVEETTENVYKITV